MHIVLHAPKNGETLSLLQEKHLEYIRNPKNDPTSKVDWLNLRETDEDLSYPAPVCFRFSPTASGAVCLRHPDGRLQRIAAKCGTATAENLLLDATYTWWVEIGEERSAEQAFHTDARPPRFLRVEGISNVRDFGGFWTNSGKRVAQNRIFRTSEMDTHVAITAAGIHTLEELGIRTDLDLRGIKDEPRAPVLDEEKVKWINIPLAAYDAIYTPEQMTRYGESYRLLTDGNAFPLMVHCWGGIDRTGCWLYILGAMLGVSKDDLDLDYEMSSFSRWSRRSRYSDQFQAFLKGLYQYGDMLQGAATAFMLACGLTKEELTQITENLLERASHTGTTSAII